MPSACNHSITCSSFILSRMETESLPSAFYEMYTMAKWSRSLSWMWCNTTVMVYNPVLPGDYVISYNFPLFLCILWCELLMCSSLVQSVKKVLDSPSLSKPYALSAQDVAVPSAGCVWLKHRCQLSWRKCPTFSGLHYFIGKFPQHYSPHLVVFIKQMAVLFRIHFSWARPATGKLLTPVILQ